jgi:predicted nucleic acid-binding protein
MNVYFDTSAIVKLFSVESGTEEVEKLINEPKNEIWLLELAETELISAVYRKLRNNEIPQEKIF